MKQQVTITRFSPVSLKENTMIMYVDPADLQKWQNGELVQVAFPYLTPAEREFIISGVLPGEWDTLFSDEES
jgi:hypothetical protein